jgi:hypothetical protein
MLKDGYTLSHRSAYTHPIVGKSRPLHHWTWRWMVDLAWFKDSDDIKRGQFRATCRQIAAAWGMPLATFHRFKNELVAAGMITVVDGPTRRAPSLWTIVNYDRFQVERTLERTVERKRNTNGTQASKSSTDSDGGSWSANGTQTERTVEHSAERLKKENSRKKTLEDPPKPPKGGGPLIDEKGNKWPMVPKKGKVSYSEPFNHIWQQWLDGQKSKPDAISATDKANAYTLVREHVADGTATPDEIYIATRNYIRLYTSGRKKVGAYHPSRFYRRKAPTFLDHIGTIGTGTTESPTGITDRWHNPRDAWRECASLSTHLGLELPDVPKRTYGAEWEDVEKFHPLIVEFATDRSGFKQVPDDLSSRIQGVG